MRSGLPGDIVLRVKEAPPVGLFNYRLNDAKRLDWKKVPKFLCCDFLVIYYNKLQSYNFYRSLLISRFLQLTIAFILKQQMTASIFS
ncbi:hypothetical protein X975_06632, partial [Stegodyphus mimosarum]